MGDSQHAAQLIRRHFHRPRRWRGAWRRLWECGGQSRVERDVAFHLLHDLMDMPVQDGDGTEALQVSERLLAVVSAPTPFGIHRPERDMSEDDNRRTAF